MHDENRHEIMCLQPDHFKVVKERVDMTDKLVELLQDYKPNAPMSPDMRTRFLAMMEELEP